MNRPDPSNEATVIVRRESLVGPVLGRVIGMLAARADAPVDRLDDVLLVSDAIAAHGPSHADDDAGLQVHIRTTPDDLVLRIGPLAPDGGAAPARSRRPARRGQHRRAGLRAGDDRAEAAPGSTS